ncbi:DUF5667 domain-containing protein [Streptosporangium carneum]|uniref:DUF5667 domain-containing protein n=1 Tax=Streptosporangium carneum TaxID=47481 RepID=A0A9W6HX94_9ACTN|nr:DUF5667 domain-containing protein [Streptosporangium carneum]GLK07762.1 hypothetical protein GCM10017600_11670 [Streptosporangium carneum]
MGKWLPGISRRSQTHIQNSVSTLGSRLGGEPRPEFRAELRERLMHAPEQPEQEESSAQPVVPPRPRRRTVLLPQLLSLGLASAMVVAGLGTYRSMPGDALYPLKRAAENTLFHLSTDDAERADRSFGYAETRAHEVEELLGSGEREDRLISETLKAMEDTTRSAVTSLTRVQRRDARSTGQLKRFVQKQRTQIEIMLPKMDEEDRRRANGYLDYIDGLTPPGTSADSRDVTRD